MLQVARAYQYLHSCPTMLSFFFFNATATTEIYTLSLHDALPIWQQHQGHHGGRGQQHKTPAPSADRKSTRLNSSHLVISYAVFCLKKNKCLNLMYFTCMDSHSMQTPSWPFSGL